MNENWSLHLTLLNNRTGQKIGGKLSQNKYEILEMLDRCQIPYGSGDYAHLAVPFPDGTPDSLQLKLAGVIENEHCPPSIRQINFLAEQLQRMSAESREALNAGAYGYAHGCYYGCDPHCWPFALGAASSSDH